MLITNVEFIGNSRSRSRKRAFDLLQFTLFIYLNTSLIKNKIEYCNYIFNHINKIGLVHLWCDRCIKWLHVHGDAIVGYIFCALNMPYFLLYNIRIQYLLIGFYFIFIFSDDV